MGSRGFWAATGLLTIVCLVLLELGSYLVIGFLNRNPASSVLFYAPPTITPQEYEQYLDDRDPVLGWPSLSLIGKSMYDKQGARPSPAFPESVRACVSLYGDSFTYGTDVTHAQAWGNLLAARLGCRVANFGVGGYGLDQAYIRLVNNDRDRAPITILGILPHDLQRNLAQNVYFIFGSYPLGFKPRFIYEDGLLTLIPLPSVSPSELEAYTRDPRAYLPYESFLPDTRLGPSRVGFPYTLALARAALGPAVVNRLRGRPAWMTYVDPTDASGGFTVAGGILKAFGEECARRAKLCAVLFFPTPSEMNYYRESNSLAMQGLIDKTQSLNLPTLNLLKEMAEVLDGSDFCQLLISPDNCAGHYNAAGNLLIADTVYGFLHDGTFQFGRTLKFFRDEQL